MTDNLENNSMEEVDKSLALKVNPWEEMERLYKEGGTLNVQVSEVVKGGVVAHIEGIRAFIPASHLSLSYVEDLQQYVGQELIVKIIELDQEKNKLVLSRKEVEKSEKQAEQEKLWQQLKKGEKRKGIVCRLAKFGAFVDLGGLDGLIHLSDLSWGKVDNPGDVVSVGDEVEVTVLDFDQEKNRISLGLKEEKDNPWLKEIAKYKDGDMAEGTVVKLANFGAFVELEPGVQGLVHLSQISEEHISTPSSVLAVGDKVKVKILKIDEEKKKLSLSIKEAAEKEEGNFSEYVTKESSGVTLGDLFKDKLKGLKFD